ncbi:MAG: hypothetical protein Q8K60_02765 [Parachlamydiaceae bacterium]|nr:hypothetical protein [Parachlamydiaceae bacterium]
MSDLNIPHENIPNEFKVDSTSSFSQPLPSSSTKPPAQDHIINSENPERMKYPSEAMKNEREIPQLKSPEISESVSLASLLETIAMADFKTKQALRVSDIGNLHNRYLQSLGLSNEVMTYAELETARDTALEGVDEYVDELEVYLQDQLDEINDEIKEMNTLINEFNQGNIESKQACQDLLDAYQKMLTDLEALGMSPQQDGNYYIPLSSADEYNAVISEYQASVDEFNAYWEERNAEIEKMNVVIDKYNTAMKEHQQELENFSDFYDLPPFSPIPLVKPVTIYNETVRVPPLVEDEIGGGTKIIYISPPPSYVSSYAQYVPGISSMDLYREHSSGYAGYLYNSCVNKINKIYNMAVENGLEYWTFLSNNFDYSVDNDPNVEPILNEKPLFFKLFELNVKFEELRESKLEEINKKIKKEDALIDQLVDKEVKVILGDEINKEVLAGISPSLSESQINKLSNYLDILSLQIINQNLLISVFPSLQPIGNVIGSLPKDSPVFGLLFSVSFLNRILEHVNGGMSKAPIDSIINKMPEFSSLTEEAKKTLEANLNIGLLLTAGKLVEANLGLPGLLTKILPETASHLSLNPQLPEFNQQKTELMERYTFQGFPPEESKFLADVAIEILQHGVLTPSAPIITEQTINQPLLINTLKSALILSDNGISLKDADIISQQAVSNVFLESPKLTPKQFRQSLENYLQEEGISTNTKEIVKESIVLMKEKPDFNVSEIQDHLLSLLTPQMGVQLAKEVIEEVQIALFGTSQPSTSAKSPYFLTNSIKQEVEKTYSQENKTFGKKQTEAFETAMETSLNLSAFLLKMMDPAYSLIHSSQTGLIYTSNTKERPLII